MKYVLFSMPLMLALLTIIFLDIGLQKTLSGSLSINLKFIQSIKNKNNTNGITVEQNPAIIGSAVAASNSYVVSPNSIMQADYYHIQPDKASGISVGKSPTHISVNPNTNTIYVSNEGSNTISMIDGSTNKVVKTITLGFFTPYGIAVNSKSNLVYVRDFRNPSHISTHHQKIYPPQVSVIDGSIGKVVSNFTLKYSGEDIAVNNITNIVYVTDGDEAISVINGSSNKPIANLTGLECCIDHIAVNPRTNMVYVTSVDSSTIYVINGSSNRPIANLRVPESPDDIAVNPRTNMVYVNNEDADRLSILNGSSNNVIKTVVAGNYSHGKYGSSALAVNPTNNLVYLTNNKLGIVSIIDGSSNNVIKTVGVGRSVSDIAVNPTTNLVYMANSDSGTVSVIDGNKNSMLIGINNTNPFYQSGLAVSGIKVGSLPSSIAVNPNTNKIYVTYELPDKLSVIDGDTDKLLTTVSVASKSDKSINNIPISELDGIGINFPYSELHGIAVDSNTNTVYVSNFYSDQLYFIDGETDRTVASIRVGINPVAVAINPNTNMIYVPALNGTLSIIDSFQANVLKKISLYDSLRPDSLRDVAANPNTYFEYITGDKQVYVLQGKYVTKYPLGNMTLDGFAVASNPNTNLVYVTRPHANTVSVIDDYTNSIVSNIKVGDSPENIALNPNTNMVYVTNTNSKSVSVINGKTNSVVANLPLGEASTERLDKMMPYAIAVNPKTNLVYVTDMSSNIVYVINGKTNSLSTGVNFNVSPPTSGSIYCNGMKILNNYTRYDIGTEVVCRADANKQSIFGFKPIDNLLWSIHDIFSGGMLFSSWSGNLVPDSNNPKTTFEVYRYGTTLTANFSESSPLIPEAYMTTILAIAIPSIGAWLYKSRARFSKRTGYNYRDRYMKVIDTVYSTIPAKNIEEHLKQLADIRTQVKDLFVRGTISDMDYKILNDKISDYMEKRHNDATAATSSNDISSSPQKPSKKMRKYTSDGKPVED